MTEKPSETTCDRCSTVIPIESKVMFIDVFNAKTSSEEHEWDITLCGECSDKVDEFLDQFLVVK